ncbi:MAG TPA: beta-ketoacyl-ACP synthase 3 [Acidimicrobiales bacterium]|nr:beta-ketoacyl-ACP synthase 3 [Acidimicrobiales bacterium]
MIPRRGAALTGWGGALPATEVSNGRLSETLDTSDEWIYSRSGIRARRLAAGPLVAPDAGAGPDGVGTTATLAIAAGRQALERAGLDGASVGMLLLCTTTPDQAMPGTAAAVAAALGITGGALDLNAACAGFAYGLVVGASLVSSGVEHVLLVGADTMSRVTNFADRSTAVLFGDGAGAVTLSATVPPSLLGWDTGVDGALVSILYAPLGSGMVMKGQEVFRQAVRAARVSAINTLKQAGVTGDEVALFVPHQANSRIMAALSDQVGIPPDRLASVVESTANTGAASIPLALADAADRGRLRPGDLVLFAGFGSGMTWATSLWQWTDSDARC